MLLKATSRPAQNTERRSPARQKDRFAELCQDQLRTATKTQRDAWRRPGLVTCRSAAAAQWWLRVFPTLSIRRPVDSGPRDPKEPGTMIKGNRKLQAVVMEQVKIHEDR